MVLTGSVSVIKESVPTKAIPNTDIKIKFNVTWQGAGLKVYALYIVLINKAEPDNCLKMDKVYTCYSVCLPVPVPDDSGQKEGDIVFTVPDKDYMEFYLELWDGGLLPGTIPSKYAGKCKVEEVL